MLSKLLRRLLFQPGAPIVESKHLAQPKPTQEELDHFNKLLSDLRRAAPDAIRPALEDAVRSYQEEPVNGPELLDAIDNLRSNLGIAIGRGATGQDERYEGLTRVVSWLYAELGQPQNTSYAVLVRAARALEEREREQRHGEA
jgi:hypothetical protein